MSADTPSPTAPLRQRGELIGDGREAEVLAWGDGRVLRLLKDPANADRLERERLACEAAARAGVRAPRVFGRHDLEGRPGLVMERVHGPDLLTALSRRPWTLRQVGRTLGRTHAEIHRVTAPAGLPSVHERLAEQLGDERIPRALRAPAARLLEALPERDRLCHWDFQPANLIDTGDTTVVIDWSFAARGDPAVDVARTLLILAVGEAPESASIVARRLDRLGRRALATAYSKAYTDAGAHDRRAVDTWTPLAALSRLTAGIPGERQRLLELAGRVASAQD